MDTFHSLFVLIETPEQSLSVCFLGYGFRVRLCLFCLELSSTACRNAVRVGTRMAATRLSGRADIAFDTSRRTRQLFDVRHCQNNC